MLTIAYAIYIFVRRRQRLQFETNLSKLCKSDGQSSIMYCLTNITFEI